MNVLFYDRMGIPIYFMSYKDEELHLRAYIST